MVDQRLRNRIACEAARLLFSHHEQEFLPAKRRAARLLCPDGCRASQLPTDAEVRSELHALATAQGDSYREIAGDYGPVIVYEADRFRVYQLLLLPLAQVSQSRLRHPEGDALYHSLQVFEHAREALPYDEEFLLAALLHDVGKAIDAANHVQAGLEALAGFITERTAWFIEHHVEAHALREGTLGVRSHRRLRQSPDYDELLLLARCDLAGRRIGVRVAEVEGALEYIRELAEMCEE